MEVAEARLARRHVEQCIAERIWPGARIERSIFGTDDPDEIWRCVLALCRDAVSCFAFEVGVGARFGLLLGDGSRLALEVHLPVAGVA